MARAPGMAHPPPRCVARRGRAVRGGGCGGGCGDGAGDGGAAGARRAAGTERGDLTVALGKKKKRGFADELLGAGAPGVGDVLKQAEGSKVNVRALFTGEKEEAAAAADVGTEGEKQPVGATSDADRCPCGGGAQGLPYSRCGGRATLLARLLYSRHSPRHEMPVYSRNEGSNACRWRGGHRHNSLIPCSPRHRMPFKLRNEGSTCVSMTWRTKLACPHSYCAALPSLHHSPRHRMPLNQRT